ncbi:hypothetical protein SAMN04487896_0407 [Paenibacillus sp. ov031]|nr:hypothetical protein SAMN04487896_0407 [Paenibacillus sp. ov031]
MHVILRQLGSIVRNIVHMYVTQNTCTDEATGDVPVAFLYAENGLFLDNEYRIVVMMRPI